MKSAGRGALVLFWLLIVCAPVRAEDRFYVVSSPSAWVGHGQTLDFSAVTTHRYFQQGAYTNALTFFAGGYDVTIVGPNYSLVTVGSYDNATRWPFMGSGPGLDFVGNGRGNNTLTGRFDVLQADYNADGSVKAFALNFLQYDEGSPQAWNQGYVRYNSALPIPEPATALLIAAAPLLALQRRRH